MRPVDKEEWRLVEGTEDYYVSNRGRFKRGKRILKTSLGKDGYYRCNIGKSKKRVHRLVAMAFIPNPDNLPIVDHIDGCKTNNCVENLRWVTHQENIQAAYDMGLFDNAVTNRNKSVLVICQDDEVYAFNTLVEASKFTGVTLEGVSKCVRGIDKQRHGYKFFRMKDFHDYREY